MHYAGGKRGTIRDSKRSSLRARDRPREWQAMHESGDLLPDSSELLQLHQRLIDSDPTAPSDMAAIFLESLILWLQEHNRGIDPDLCSEAAGEAIISLIQKPASYRPELLELPAYLRMSAQRDLQNVLRRELKHHAQCR